MRQPLNALVLLACGGLIIWAGCRVPEARLPESGATLEGSVTYGGSPVPMAMIIVMGTGGSATGYVGDNGRYKVENAPLGEVKIGVNTEAMRGQLISQSMAKAYQGPGGKGRGSGPPPFVSVPQKYAEPETSGVSTTIKKGANTLDIGLAK